MEFNMTDPSGLLTTKIASMIGGLFGGAAILTFIRPKTIGEAFTRGGISVGSAIIFGIPLLESIGLKVTWETQLMSGFCVGFVSYSILGMVANFLAKNQNKDVVEVVRDIRDVSQGTKKQDKS
jgi:hypothetical protein